MFFVTTTLKHISAVNTSSLYCFINSYDNTVWSFLLSHIQVHIHKSITEKLKYLHDSDYTTVLKKTEISCSFNELGTFRYREL